MVQDPQNVHFYDKRGIEVDEKGHSLLLSRRTKLTSKLSRVTALAYPEWKLLSVGTISLLLASASSLLLPFFFGEIIDDATNPNNDNLNRNIMILTIIAVSGSLFSLVRGWAFNLAGYNLVSRMRQDLFEAIIRQEIGFFDVSRVGELTSRLSSDTSVIQSSITVNISMVLRYSIQIVASVVVMFWLSAPLTGVLLSVVPLVAVGAAQYGRFYARKVKHFQDALGIANTTAEECLSNVRTIRSFACDAKACEKYNEDIDNSLKIGRTLSFIYGAFQGVVSLLVQCALVLVLWYGGKLVLEHSKDSTKGISIGHLSSFMMYSLGVAMAFAFLSSVFGDMMKAVGASTRLFQLVDRQPAIEQRGVVRIEESELEAKIDFDSVTFAYPVRPTKHVLSGISFSVEAGQTVALVGPSGGGKSTCINLLLHFYEPSSGVLKFGGVDIRDLDWDWFHEQVAVVSQEPVLFGYSVRENIAFGKKATNEEVVEAAKLANAHDFISSLENGYDTLVGERGVRLSGGQKQRVAIARALIMNPRVLLLDEATSALDAESEAIVKEAIDRAMINRTVLVIAHRLSTVKHADMVIVIENGSISEMGTHEKLLEKEGVYKKLVIHQLMETGTAYESSMKERTNEINVITTEHQATMNHVTQAEVNEVQNCDGTPFRLEESNDESSQLLAHESRVDISGFSATQPQGHNVI
ncbi:ABC transporter B family member 1-like isoform X2 [Symsagittifera roscoffensis]